jgi:O-methyltransferase involved in polyketide biosynthesis
VVYIDIDPVAVSESTDILAGNPNVVAVNADMRAPKSILDHPKVRKLIDFGQPTAVLIAAVLHFVPDDAEAYGLVDELRAALAPGSYLLISHASAEGFLASSKNVEAIKTVYSQKTATPGGTRDREGVERFFTGMELVEPGVTWSTTWRPADGDPNDFADDPRLSCIWAAVGKLP